jgi:hypothetical protein
MAEMTLTGASLHKGDVEGRPYHFTRVYLLSAMPANDTHKGFKSVDLKTVDPNYYELLQKLSFPCVCDVEIDIRASGRPGESDMVVRSVKPIPNKQAA